MKILEYLKVKTQKVTQEIFLLWIIELELSIKFFLQSFKNSIQIAVMGLKHEDISYHYYM